MNKLRSFAGDALSLGVNYQGLWLTIGRGDKKQFFLLEEKPETLLTALESALAIESPPKPAIIGRRPNLVALTVERTESDDLIIRATRGSKKHIEALLTTLEGYSLLELLQKHWQR
jgi:hypothetical protein